MLILKPFLSFPQSEGTNHSLIHSVNVTLVSSEADQTAVQWDRHGEQSKVKQFCSTGISSREL